MWITIKNKVNTVYPHVDKLCKTTYCYSHYPSLLFNALIFLQSLLNVFVIEHLFVKE